MGGGPDLSDVLPLPSQREAGTKLMKLYCLVTEAHVCEKLAQGHYLAVQRTGIERGPLSHRWVSYKDTLQILAFNHHRETVRCYLLTVNSSKSDLTVTRLLLLICKV